MHRLAWIGTPSVTVGTPVEASRRRRRRAAPLHAEGSSTEAGIALQLFQDARHSDLFSLYDALVLPAAKASDEPLDPTLVLAAAAARVESGQPHEALRLVAEAYVPTAQPELRPLAELVRAAALEEIYLEATLGLETTAHSPLVNGRDREALRESQRIRLGVAEGTPALSFQATALALASAVRAEADGYRLDRTAEELRERLLGELSALSDPHSDTDTQRLAAAVEVTLAGEDRRASRILLDRLLDSRTATPNIWRLGCRLSRLWRLGTSRRDDDRYVLRRIKAALYARGWRATPPDKLAPEHAVARSASGAGSEDIVETVLIVESPRWAVDELMEATVAKHPSALRASRVGDIPRLLHEHLRGRKMQNLVLIGHGGPGVLSMGCSSTYPITLGTIINGNLHEQRPLFEVRDFFCRDRDPLLQLLGCSTGDGAAGALTLYALGRMLDVRVEAPRVPLRPTDYDGFPLDARGSRWASWDPRCPDTDPLEVYAQYGINPSVVDAIHPLVSVAPLQVDHIGAFDIWGLDAARFTAPDERPLRYDSETAQTFLAQFDPKPRDARGLMLRASGFVEWMDKSTGKRVGGALVLGGLGIVVDTGRYRCLYAARPERADDVQSWLQRLEWGRVEPDVARPRSSP